MGAERDLHPVHVVLSIGDTQVYQKEKVKKKRKQIFIFFMHLLRYVPSFDETGDQIG